MVKAYLELTEVVKLEEATSYLRDRILIKLLFRLGCRVSEALGLKVEDIDFMHRTITIKHLKIRLTASCPNCGGRLSAVHLYCPMCGHKIETAQTEQWEHRRQRVLPADKDTLNMLKDYIKRGGPVIKDGKKLIFGINRHRAWQVVRECAERVGLPDLVNPETGKRRGVSPHPSEGRLRRPRGKA